jgi:hypothetical protein
MVRITHKEIAKILGVSEGYSQQLFHRKGLRMSNQYLSEIIEIICERRGNAHNRVGKEVKSKRPTVS